MFLIIAVLFSFWGITTFRASQIKIKDYYSTKTLTKDARLQYEFLKSYVNSISPKKLWTVNKGYSDFCGYSVEWEPIFLMFYSMALYEISKTNAIPKEELRRQSDLCTRIVLNIPLDMKGEKLKKFIEEQNWDYGDLYDSYAGIVINIRELFYKDSIYEKPARQMAEQLQKSITKSLKGSSQFWTSDQATQLYSIYLYGKAYNKDFSSFFKYWLDAMESRFVDKKKNVLNSLVQTNPDEILSKPRASSIAWTVIFLADIFPSFAYQQYKYLDKHRVQSFGNFSAVGEFTNWPSLYIGDLDSGPLVFGYSPSATGFTLAAHRIANNPSGFMKTLRTIEIFAKPIVKEGKKHYYLGNAMGDAVLLYAKTAQPRFH